MTSRREDVDVDLLLLPTPIQRLWQRARNDFEELSPRSKHLLGVIPQPLNKEGRILAKFKLVKSQVADVMGQIDKVQAVSSTFLRHHFQQVSPAKLSEAIEDTFKTMDIRGRGWLNARELRQAFTCMGCLLSHAEFATLLQQFDSDHDGQFDQADFTRMFRHLLRRPAAGGGGGGGGGGPSPVHASRPSVTRRGMRAGADDDGALDLRRRAAAAAERIVRRHFESVARGGAGRLALAAWATFRAFDSDSNGTLDLQELQRAFAAMGQPLSESELQGVLHRYDANGDGTVDLDEFQNLVRSAFTRRQERRRRQERQQGRDIGRRARDPRHRPGRRAGPGAARRRRRGRRCATAAAAAAWQLRPGGLARAAGGGQGRAAG